MAEPVRVCTKCEERKPWSAFSPRSYWEDGTLRNVHGKCKACLAERARAYRKRDPENTREIKIRYLEKLRRDRRRYRRYLEKQREYNATYNEKSGRVQNPGIRRKPEVATTLPCEPFTEWLQKTFDTVGEAYNTTGIDSSAMSRYYNGSQPGVSIETVERALLSVGAHIDEVYPVV